MTLGRVPAGTIQRSPLSDKVRAAAGIFPSLSSVLAALSGEDVQVSDADLDQAISDMLGGRAEDIALAQQVRSRELGTTRGWTGPPKRQGRAVKRSITVRYVAGRTARRALVIAGVHGSEVQGIEVAEQLLKDLAKAQSQPEVSTVIVPDLFPDNAAYRDREGPGAPPNRNFPDPSQDLAASGGRDARNKAILPENVMLMQLIERFAPERIISIHGSSAAALAGVSYDPRALSAAEQARTQSSGIDSGADARDKALALSAAGLIDTRTSEHATRGPARGRLKHPSVAGNFKGNSAQPNFARWEGAMDPGVSLGGYASGRGISIFTVEPPDDSKLSEFSGAARKARDFEIKAYAEAVPNDPAWVVRTPHSASSSATTSPLSRTLATPSSGVGPCVRIASAPPAPSVSCGRAATGYTSSEEPTHSSTSAPSHSSRARSSACGGSSSPNSTTSGFSGRTAVLAAWNPVRRALQAHAHLLQRHARATQQTRAAGDAAVHLDQLARARLAVQHVDVLRDHRVEQPVALHRHERVVGAVGELAAERREALAVEAPEAHGVAAEGVDVRDLHRVDLLPHARARRAEVGDAGRHRDAGARQRHDRAAALATRDLRGGQAVCPRTARITGYTALR